MTVLRAIALTLTLLMALVYLFNASWLAPTPDQERSFIAHRGVSQTYPHEGLENDTCTAERIHPPTHTFLENTLPSIEAAFAAGAAVVEIDIHPTTDGEFAVFHDWTIDCRTEGAGVTRRQSMAYLRTLDAGYGYTADGGETYPLRGGGVGMIPSLGEVLDAFPNQRFLINFKGGRAEEAERLSAYLVERGDDVSRLMVYGAERPVARMKALHPDMIGSGRRSFRACVQGYVLTGWFGRVPTSCENTIIFVPRNYAWMIWGWPNRFQQRMADAGSEVWVIGDWDGARSFTTGLDDPAQLDSLSERFRGGVWTNRIEVIAPAAGAGQN